jgi:hypothetical protein
MVEKLKPHDALQMGAYPVSNRVNQVQNDNADCANPVERESPPQGQLFGQGDRLSEQILFSIGRQLCDTSERARYR